MQDPTSMCGARRSAGFLVSPRIPHRSYRVARRWMRVAICLTGVFSALLVRGQVVQPPEPVDPRPIDGEVYYLVNQLSGLQVDLNNGSTAAGETMVLNTRSFTNLSQRWAFTRALDGNWKISNLVSDLCLDSAFSRGTTYVVQKPCKINVPTQEWFFTYVKNGYNVVTNVGTRLALNASSANLALGTQLVESPTPGSQVATRLWLFRPAFFRGNDSSLQEKTEYDRVLVNNASSYPWWHDAYLPGRTFCRYSRTTE